MERKQSQWYCVILWLSRETGHTTSAFYLVGLLNDSREPCLDNMPSFKPKGFYIHVL